MKILAVETSTEYCSVALWQDGTVRERCELVGQKHSEVLMAMLDALLKDAGYRIQIVDGIAFGKGPGSFTGVRIACGVAQGLALGANLPVVGVCTLEAIAETSGKDKVIAALDARMGELYLAAYERRDGAWHAVIEPCLCKAELRPCSRDAGAGPGTVLPYWVLPCRPDTTGIFGQTACRVLCFRVRLRLRYWVPPNSRRAKVWMRALALPLYLRDKVALKTSERTK